MSISTWMQRGNTVRCRFGRIGVGAWWYHGARTIRAGRFMYGWSRTYWLRVGPLCLHVEVFNCQSTPQERQEAQGAER